MFTAAVRIQRIITRIKKKRNEQRRKQMAIAGIVAGGSGSRMGSAKPKQFIELCYNMEIL